LTLRHRNTPCSSGEEQGERNEPSHGNQSIIAEHRVNLSIRSDSWKVRFSALWTLFDVRIDGNFAEGTKAHLKARYPNRTPQRASDAI
jgi:hypothetical protein